jgi:hypothetical protein
MLQHQVDYICERLASLTQYEWFLQDEEHWPTDAPVRPIRCYYDGDGTSLSCPLLVFHRHFPRTPDMPTSLFESEVGEAIMRAADDAPGHDRTVRRKLLEACRLAVAA